MADIFSSHPYKRPDATKPESHYCVECEQTMKGKDRVAHQRGKKHAAKVLEKHPQAENASVLDAKPSAPTGNECHNCGQEGHRKSDCTNPRKDTRTCNNCQQTGHVSRECPNKRPDDRPCFKCRQTGHQKSDCPNPAVIVCRNCDEEGHAGRDCPKPRDYSRVKCNNCHEMGHTVARCKAPPAEMRDHNGWDSGPGTTTQATGGWDTGAAGAGAGAGAAPATHEATGGWDAVPAADDDDDAAEETWAGNPGGTDW